MRLTAISRPALTLALTGFVLAPATADAELLLRYEFSEGTGTTAASTGSATAPLTLQTQAGAASADLWATVELPSGATGPVFDNTDAASTGLSGPRAVTGDVPALANLASMTITGWVNLDTAPGAPGSAAARLVAKTRSGGMDPGDFELSLVNNNQGNPILQFGANGAGSVNSAAIEELGETGTWVFVAVTFDSTQATDNLRFYVGAPDAPITAAASTHNYAGGAIGDSTTGLGIGNLSFSTARAVDGFLHDIRIYGGEDAGGALSASELEAVRLEAVPEPSSMALSLLGLGLLARRVRRDA